MSALEIERRQDPASVDRILRSLPGWFGIEEAILNYVDSASRRDSFLAVMRGEVVGVALVDRHFPESAELALIAVHAGRRGAGIGASLVTAVEEVLVSDDCGLLQVHTVGPSFEDDAYAQTRAFYIRSGFLPLQEFNRIDWDGPTLVLVKPLAR
ncbi:GNAT family N-acetyltransferase [Microbacterium sp. Bi128]|uniref:GNAT family N-acetyltransferase n=1 Tax=Microbacterium sp. Bi128 TaxID=2821115 RepID=UPI001E4EFB9C|nr:GNAT family N-acetyltransferase [Microbacterium sp. Bi128]